MACLKGLTISVLACAALATACGGATASNSAQGAGSTAGGAGASGTGEGGAQGGTGGTTSAGPSCADSQASWTFYALPSATTTDSRTRRPVWGSGATDVWVVGPGVDEGHHFDGRHFTHASVTSAPDFAPYAIWGFSDNDVYVAPETGPSAHFDGTSWNVSSNILPAFLGALWGPAPGTLFFVGGGEGGLIARLNPDGTWKDETASPGPLTAVSGSSGSDVFAVGPDGDVLHRDANGWTEITAFGGSGPGFTGVASLGPGRAIAVGGTVSDVSGGTTKPDAPYAAELTPTSVTGDALPALPAGVQLPARLTGVWAARSDLAFAVSDGGFFLVYDGHTWSVGTLPSTTHLLGVWGTAANNVFFTAEEGVWHCGGGA